MYTHDRTAGDHFMKLRHTDFDEVELHLFCDCGTKCLNSGES